jgi:short-subunit dehydrogenase
MFLFAKAPGPNLISQNLGQVVNVPSGWAFAAVSNHSIYHAGKSVVAHLAMEE